jgi:hypothetical protein
MLRRLKGLISPLVEFDIKRIQGVWYCRAFAHLGDGIDVSFGCSTKEKTVGCCLVEIGEKLIGGK